VSTCDYEYHGGSVDFKCLELVHGREMTRCMFHDINYLEDDNYEKNKEKVGKRFKRKLSNYRSTSNLSNFLAIVCLRFHFRIPQSCSLRRQDSSELLSTNSWRGKDGDRAITSWKQYPDNTIIMKNNLCIT
jgi:hypothetical protein